MAWSTARSSPARPSPSRTDAHLRVDGDIVEDDLRGAAPVDGGIVAAIDTRLRLVDDEQADTVAIALRARGSRRDDQTVGPRRAYHHLLAAAQSVAITVSVGAQCDVVKIVTALRLCPGQGPQVATVDDAREECLPLVFGAEIAQQSAGEHDRLDEGLDDKPSAAFLHDDHCFDGTTADTAIFLGEGCCEKAQLGELLPALAGIALRARDNAHPGGGVVIGVQIFVNAVVQKDLLVAK